MTGLIILMAQNSSKLILTNIVGHGGGDPGICSLMNIYLDLGYTTNVLTNSDDDCMAADDIIKADIHVTGYWFLDHPPDWQPPPRLAEFVAAEPPPVYVGFGSMSGHEPQATVHLIVAALRLTGQRAVLLASRDGLDRAMLPDSVCAVDDVPHDWLFPQMATMMALGRPAPGCAPACRM